MAKISRLSDPHKARRSNDSKIRRSRSAHYDKDLETGFQPVQIFQWHSTRGQVRQTIEVCAQEIAIHRRCIILCFVVLGSPYQGKETISAILRYSYRYSHKSLILRGMTDTNNAHEHQSLTYMENLWVAWFGWPLSLSIKLSMTAETGVIITGRLNPKWWMFPRPLKTMKVKSLWRYEPKWTASLKSKHRWFSDVQLGQH